jgi:hypothetical protein
VSSISKPVWAVQHDALDEGAQDLEHLGLGVRVGECGLQIGDLAPLVLSQVGMERAPAAVPAIDQRQRTILFCLYE